jgi:hypothetical protein
VNESTTSTKVRHIIDATIMMTSKRSELQKRPREVPGVDVLVLGSVVAALVVVIVVVVEAVSAI